MNMAKKDIDMENYPFKNFSDEDMQKIKKWERENWIQSAYARKEAFSVTQYYQEVLEEIEYEEHEKMLNVNEEMEKRIDSGEIFGKSEKERKVDFATNEIIDKIRAAGIEVVTDKDEFDKILEKENFLQKMAETNIKNKHDFNRDIMWDENIDNLQIENIKNIFITENYADTFEQAEILFNKCNLAEGYTYENVLRNISNVYNLSSENGDYKQAIKLLAENGIKIETHSDYINRLKNVSQYSNIYPLKTLDISRDNITLLNMVSVQINDYINKKYNPKNNRFDLPNSPEYLKVLGADDTEISLPTSVVKKAIEKHDFTSNEIIEGICRLYDPLFVVEKNSENNKPSFFIITDSFKDTKPIVLAVNINDKIGKKNKIIEVQDVRTIFDKVLLARNGTDLIKQWASEDSIKYIDDKKISDWNRLLPRNYFPIELLQSDTNNIIKKSDIVNNTGIMYMKENNNTYGFVHNNKIYLNPELMNSNAAVHEYTHLWDAYTQRTNPELWNKGMNLFKDTKYWNEVVSDLNYQDIKYDENLVLSEIHSRICGDIAEKVLNRIAELDGEQIKLDAIDWNKETAGYVLELIKDLNPENSFIQQMKEENIKEDILAFFNTPMKDLIQEKNILISNEVSWTPLYNGRDTDYTSFNGHTVERYFAGINKNNENTYSVKIDGVPLTFIDEETNEENELYFSEKELDKQILNDTLYYGKSMDEINFNFNNKTSSIISEPSISYMPKKDPAVTRDVINQAKARRASYCHSVVKGEKKGLWKSFNEFQRHGVFDIQGQTLMTDKNGHLTDTGFKQLAISMDIYRDKRFESARYVFVDKNGTIKDQMALSTFMPNHSISKLDETFKQVLEHAEKTNTKIAFVHNHPSGNIEASYDDIQFTKELESYLNQDNKDLFLGHVILDHDTFNCYSPESKWNSVTFEHPGKDRFEKEVPDFAKTVIDGDKKLREIAQSINSTNEYNKDWIPVIFARENASVGGVEYFNKDFFIENDSNAIKNEFEKIGLLCGSDRAIPVVPNGMSYEPELHSEMINKFREGCFYDMALGNRTTTDLHLTKYSNEIFNYTQKEMEEMTKIESTFEPVKVSKKEVGVSSKVAENKTYYVRENIQPVNVKTLLEKHEDIPIFDHKYFVDQKFLPAFTFANNDVYVRCNAKNLAINSELKLNPEKKVDLILSKKQFAQIIATEKLKEKVARMHDFEVNNKAITPIVVAPNNMTALQQDLIFHQNNHLNYTERKEAFSSMYKEIMDNVKQIETKTLSTNQKTILDINQEFNKMQKPNSINSVQKTPGQEYDNSVDFGI